MIPKTLLLAPVVFPALALGCAPELVPQATHTNSAHVAAVQVGPDASYERAVALGDEGRVDDAVREYRDADARMGNDDPAKPVVVYGLARALDMAGRCEEAKSVYVEYEGLVIDREPAKAEMARVIAGHCIVPAVVDPLLEAVSIAVIDRQDARVVALTDGVAGADVMARRRSPWLDYDRAIALARLHRTDEAVASFRRAEARFGAGEGTPHEHAIAIYGRARALDDAGRCVEAERAYAEYASVREASPADAEMAVEYARGCRGGARW